MSLDSFLLTKADQLVRAVHDRGVHRNYVCRAALCGWIFSDGLTSTIEHGFPFNAWQVLIMVVLLTAHAVNEWRIRLNVTTRNIEIRELRERPLMKFIRLSMFAAVPILAIMLAAIAASGEGLPLVRGLDLVTQCIMVAWFYLDVAMVPEDPPKKRAKQRKPGYVPVLFPKPVRAQ
jgi:hypothetical protein